MNIVKRQSPNQNIGRQGWIPDIIVCHITEGSFDGTVSWITNPSSRVSYHFVVARDGRIVQSVNISNTAWSNGTTSGFASNGSRNSRISEVRARNVNANLYTISIGFEGRLSQKQGNLSDAQLASGIDLINHICGEVKRIFGTCIPVDRDSIVGHADITPLWKPNCPGSMFPFDKIINQLKELNQPEDNNGTMRFKINNQIIYIPAFIRNDRTYVQARSLVESMGYVAEWDDDTRTVVVSGLQ